MANGEYANPHTRKAAFPEELNAGGLQLTDQRVKHGRRQANATITPRPAMYQCTTVSLVCSVSPDFKVKAHRRIDLDFLRRINIEGSMPPAAA